MPRDRVKETIEASVVSDYLNEMAVREVSSKNDVSIESVYAILKRRGVVLRSRSGKNRDAKIVRLCTSGTTVKDVAKQLDVSEKTVSRTISKIRKSGKTVTVHQGRPSTSRVTARLLDRKLPVNLADLDKIDEIVDALIGTPFPYPAILDLEKSRQEFNALKKMSIHLVNDEICPWSPVGARICIPYFPNRYSATWKNLPSAKDAWKDEKLIRKAVRFQIMHGNPVSPKRVLRAITLQLRTPTVFRPIVAKFVYENFCPKNGLVWDPCAGYGGRLLGASAAGVQYLGTDVDPETVAGNLRLAKSIGATTANVILSPAEKFNPPEVDLVFTSPPYFNRERYSFEDKQSWVKYKTVDGWVDNFLRPMTRNAYRALRTGSFFVVNIADLKGRTVVPLVSVMETVASDEGFVLEKTLKMPLSRMNRNNPHEPILVFKK